MYSMLNLHTPKKIARATFPEFADRFEVWDASVCCGTKRFLAVVRIAVSNSVFTLHQKPFPAEFHFE